MIKATGDFSLSASSPRWENSQIKLGVTDNVPCVFVSIGHSHLVWDALRLRGTVTKGSDNDRKTVCLPRHYQLGLFIPSYIDAPCLCCPCLYCFTTSPVMTGLCFCVVHACSITVRIRMNLFTSLTGSSASISFFHTSPPLHSVLVLCFQPFQSCHKFFCPLLCDGHGYMLGRQGMGNEEGIISTIALNIKKYGS